MRNWLENVSGAHAWKCNTTIQKLKFFLNEYTKCYHSEKFRANALFSMHPICEKDVC